MECVDLGSRQLQRILQLGRDPVKRGFPRISWYFNFNRRQTVERLSEKADALIAIAANALDDSVYDLTCAQIITEDATDAGSCPFGKSWFLETARSG